MGENSRFWVAFSILLSALALCAVMLVAMTVRAHADEAPTCLPYADMKKAIADNFGAAPAGSGIMESGKSVLMIFASPKGDTWTATMLNPDGSACLMAHGTDWMDVIPPQFSMKDRRPS